MKVRAVLSVAYLNITGILRSPVWVVPQVLTPAAIVFILFVYGGRESAVYALAGSLVAMTVSTSIGLARLVVLLKFIGFQDVFVASPVGSAEYMLGLALSRLLGALPSLAIFSVVLAYLGVLRPTNLPAVVGIVLLTWALTSTLAFTMGTNIRSAVHVDAVSSLLSTALVLLPPVYYPLEKLPPAFQKAALLVPTTHVAELMRISLGLSSSSPLPYLTGAAVCALLFSALAVKGMKWRE